MNSKTLISLSVVLGFCSSAFANSTPALSPFAYRVEAPSLQVTCDAHAQLVAEKFNQSAQRLTDAPVQNVSGACEGTHTITDSTGVQYSIDTIVVSYLAASQVQFYRANFTGQAFLDTPSEGTGLFETYDACLAEISKQEAAFEAQTGLTVVASHCDLDTLGSKTFSLTVEGFGAQKAVLYEYVPAAEFLQSKSTALLQAAQLAITTSGGFLTYIDGFHVFYYAKEAIPVTEVTLGYFQSAAECSAQLDDAKNALTSLKLDNGTVICSEDLSLEAIGAGVTLQMARQDYTDRYASFADCITDKARVIRNETSAGARVAAAICRLSENVQNDYVLDLYIDRL